MKNTASAVTYDLGRTIEQSLPEAAPTPEATDAPKKTYPTLYIQDPDCKLDLPKSGEATIKFKVVESRETERDGKESCSYDLEVQSITVAPGPEDPASDDDEIEAGLQEAEKTTKAKAEK